MLLNDIGKSPDTTLRKINQHLEANYGFRIAEDVSDRDLVAIMEQIEEEITDLKVKGNDSKDSPEISKRLLVLEGMRTLREFAILQFQSPDLENVVNGMCDFVCKNFRLSGMHHADFDDSVNDAMKHYRSSKYRFPDDMIEQRVRRGAMQKLQSMSSMTPGAAEGPTVDMESMFEDDYSESTFEETVMKGSDIGMKENDPWGGVGKRAGALGGHAGSAKDPNVLKKLNNPSLSLSPLDDVSSGSDQQVNMVRDKSGRMVPDPFAAQAAARRKGIVMKEKANLVKNLRRLLESEVYQAEVMISAKGFSEEMQEMIEKIGRLQNEDLPPVTDKMRNTYGVESSAAFQTQTYGALQGVMDALYTAKGQVDDAVSTMASTGQIGAETDMDVPIDGMEEPGMEEPGMDAGADLDLDVDADVDADLDNIEGDLAGADEFGGAEEEEPLGRAMKEAALQRKVSEMKKLVEKARALRESQLNELSPSTLKDYAGKARSQASWAGGVGTPRQGERRSPEQQGYANLASKRTAGAAKADAKAGSSSPTAPRKVNPKGYY